MNTNLPDKPTKTEWKAKKITVAGVPRTVYFGKSKTGNLLIQVRTGRAAATIYRREAAGGYVCYQLANYANGKRRLDSYASQALALHNVPLSPTASTVAEGLKLVGGLADLHAACKFYAARSKRTERQKVADAVKWFAVKPEAAANLLLLLAAVA